MKRIGCLFFVVFFLGCNKSNNLNKENAPTLTTNKVNPNGITIAFGSCNHEDDPQPLWSHIQREKADLWIWLGDAIYGHGDLDGFQEKFDLQNSIPEYQELKKEVPVIGIWDDHDYGLNDGGKELTFKKQSQQLFLDFIGMSSTDPLRKQDGIYSSYDVDKKDIKIKVLLLDTRFFRDAIVGKRGRYEQNFEGTILGQAQWEWLKTALANSKADVHIFASSIQLIAEEHGWEKWSNFPNEKKKMLDLLVSQEIKNPIFISGDRHAAELSKQEWKGKIVYDITSSGLTSVVRNPKPEANKFRVAGTPKCYTPNYGILQFSKTKELVIRTELKTGYEAPVVQERLQFE